MSFKMSVSYGALTSGQGHSWRMSGDATPTWFVILLITQDGLSDPSFRSYITTILSINVQHLDSIGFYAHNDMDMMEIGNG